MLRGNIVSNLVKKRKLRATTNFSVVKVMDSLSICVPTLFTKTKEPDISFIISATNAIRKSIRKGQLIIKLIVDTRNALKGVKGKNICRL